MGNRALGIFATGMVLLAACSSEPAPYVTDVVEVDVAVQDGASDSELDITFPDLGELPDASGVEFVSPAALAVKILNPSAETNFAVSTGSLSGAPASTVAIAGVVWGEWTSLYVETESGQRHDIALPAEGSGPVYFFSAPPLDLKAPELMGETYEVRTTVVRVVAQNAQGETAWDTVRVTAIPGFQFPAPLGHYPDVVFSDESTDVLFTLDLNRISGFDTQQVVVMESDATCSNKLGLSAKFMADDGDLVASGDQLAQDQIYTKSYRVTKGPAGVRFFRAAITIDMQGQKVVAYTPCVSLYIVNRISEVACTGAQQALQKAQQLYDAQLAAKVPMEEAKRVVVAWLRSVQVVRQAGASPDDPLIWVAFNAGFFGAVVPELWPKGSSTSLFSSTGAEVSTLTPPSSREVATLIASEDDTWKTYLDGLLCPPWKTRSKAGSLAVLRQLGRAGLAFFAGAGGTAFAGLDLATLDSIETGFSAATQAYPTALPGLWRAPQSVVFTDAPANCQELMAGPDSCVILPDGTCCTDCTSEPKLACPAHLDCRVTQAAANMTPVGTLYDNNQIDLAMGRLVLGPKNWAVTSAFVAAYAGQTRGADAAFLGFGHSLDSPGMTLAFLSAGTRTVVGVEGPLDPESGQGSGTNLFRAAMEQARPLATLVPALGRDWMDHSFRLVGSGDTDFSYGDLINPAFSTGDLKGWTYTGDARTLAFWCQQGPVAQYMAFLSTGVGFTPQTGTLKQEFCLPAGKLVFRGSFQFISHELTVSCGIPQYQDQFTMTLSSEAGQSLSLLGSNVEAVTVNMLCPCDAGACGTCPECGSPDCDCGVWFAPPGQPELAPWPAECAFNEGDAWTSGWRTPAGVNISGLAGLGKPVTLEVSVSDRGDSSNDTSVLIDSLVFE